MPSDYAAILEENLHEYGHGTRHLKILEELYPQRTHFILELIQNAEDAKARQLEFRVFDDRLELVHDGRRFNERDVRGVCGVGEGTKTEDLTAIGRFGVGFKSVFAYTKTPIIHSGDEHFRIEGFVRPYPEPTQRMGDITSITLPFNGKIARTTARREIAEALRVLDPNTLLFLRNIATLVVVIDGEQLRTLTKSLQRKKVGDARLARVSDSDDLAEGFDPEEYLIWSRPVPGYKPLRVELAALMSNDQVEPLEESPLVVFFPTEKETDLPFLIQGPYRTTPARDNVPTDDEFNQMLVRETALLMADAIWDLRQAKLLSAELLNHCGLSPHFMGTSMFAPFREAVLALLKRRSIVPTGASTFRTATSIALTADRGLRPLLSPDQIGELLGTGPLHWADRSVTRGAVPYLWDALWEDLGVPVLNTTEFFQRADEKFLARQTDEWMIQLYEYLATKPSPSAETGVRTSPIIRLEDGSHIRPATVEGRPLAYLPSNRPSPHATVSRAVLNDTTLAYLRSLGLREPDLVSDVVELVLPRYDEGDAHEIDEDTHREDLDLIASALSSASGGPLEQLRRRLANTRFLRARNAGTAELALRSPSEIFTATELSTEYFDGNPGTWLLADELPPDTPPDRFGIRTEIEVKARQPGFDGHVVLVSSHGWHERGRDGFDPKANVVGLEHALRHPTVLKAQLIWNRLVIPNVRLIKGSVESSSRQTYEGSRFKEQRSAFGDLVTDLAWLPDRTGRFHLPNELSLGDLPDDFAHSDETARALGMRTSAVLAASEELGVGAHLLRLLAEDPEAIEMLEALRAKRAKQVANDDRGDHQDLDAERSYADLFRRQTVGRPSESLGPAGDEYSDQPFRPPSATRAQRVGEAIEAAQQAEPSPSSRFRTIPRKAWEAKSGRVRDFLREQYHGGCQICGGGFLRHDGEPYFVGNYWVSFNAGRWVDNPGNALSLCPNCSARLEFGSFECPDLLEQIAAPREHDAAGRPQVTITLCGQHERITFTPNHHLELKVLLEH